MEKKDPWQAIVEALKAENVQYVFGIPGSSANLYNALYDAPEIKPILVRHEQSAAFMATAYGRLTGKPGICHGTLGPGFSNLLSGILEAYTGCTPVIAICPAVALKHEGMGALQEADQLSIVAPMTKWRTRICRPDRATWAMRRAFSIASNGKPGPVFVEVPQDVGQEKVEMPEYVPADGPLRIRGDPEKIAEAARLLLKAQKPVLIAGGGAYLSRAYEEVRKLAELLCIPVLTTASGRGTISEDHPMAVGLVGLYRTKIGKEVYESADLLISVGARMEELESGLWNWFPRNAKFVQVDIDAFEIGRNWIPDIAIVGDAKLVLRDLIRILRAHIKTKRLEMPRVRELIRAKKKYEVEVESECMTDAMPIRTRRIVKAINKIFGRNTILVNENGSLDLWSYYWPYYKVMDVGDCVPPSAQTCMGFGVAGAIGAKLAKPGKKVVCVTGDGAFQMAMKELPTAAQYKAPATWVILNNYSLGWPKYLSKIFYQERYISVDYEIQPDFAAVAESSGCYGERVEKPDAVERALNNALKANSEGLPAVLDFVVEPFDYNEYFKEFHAPRGLFRRRYS